MVGVAGYVLLGGDHWTILDAVYMTVITLSTVGYGETHSLTGNPKAQIFTLILIVVGSGILVYATSSVTAFLVEGELERMLRRRRLSREISEMSDHFILCGAGSTGIHIAEEFHKTHKSFVIVDTDEDRLTRLCEDREVPHVLGDATDEDVLELAGIERASGIILALSSDKDNLFLTVTARQLRPDIRIVARAIEPKVRGKLLRAGADAVVNPSAIGGLRMASEMIRPHVVGFLDRMLRDHRATHRFEELVIQKDSSLAGATLADSGIRQKTGTLVVAYRHPGRDEFHYSPGADLVLEPGGAIVVVGSASEVARLRDLV